MMDELSTGEAMRVARLTCDDDLQSIATAWNALSAGVPFRSCDWLATWWRHYGAGQLGTGQSGTGDSRSGQSASGGELCVLAAIDEQDQLAGLAPFHLERSAARGRVLKLLGTGDVCSDYLGILSAAGREEEVLAVIADALIDAQQHGDHDAAGGGLGWDLLELNGVAADDAAIARFVGHLIESGAQVHRRQGPNCWRIELPASWEAYLEAMSRSHRKQIRRVERRMLESGRAVLHTADAATLDAAMGILVDLHQRRRQSLGQPGCFASAAFSGFLHEAAARMLTSGRLELHWIELDGRAVAAEFHLLGDETVYAYQAGVDPEAIEEEPGRIINIATIRRAIELGRRGFDFLRGDEPYKAHWRAAPRPSLELRVVPPAASARLRHGVWLAGDAVKQWIKTGLNLTGTR
jgi:CelD/BcsL family acetyltransferase involved in cellulose biosynthesis